MVFAFTLLGSTPLFTSSGSLPTPTPLPSVAAFELNRIDAMLRTGYADPAWFRASFLAQTPASTLDGIIAQIAAALGAYRDVEYSRPNFVAHFAKGAVKVQIHLDNGYKIDRLLFEAAR